MSERYKTYCGGKKEMRHTSTPQFLRALNLTRVTPGNAEVKKENTSRGGESRVCCPGSCSATGQLAICPPAVEQTVRNAPGSGIHVAARPL